MEVEQGQHVVLGQVPGEALPGARGQEGAESVHVVEQHVVRVHESLPPRCFEYRTFVKASRWLGADFHGSPVDASCCFAEADARVPLGCFGDSSPAR